MNRQDRLKVTLDRIRFFRQQRERQEARDKAKNSKPSDMKEFVDGREGEQDDSHTSVCTDCDGTGQNNVFFKRESSNVVRCVVRDCSTCFPDATGNVSPKPGEVCIDQKEAHRLLYEEGWQELSE